MKIPDFTLKFRTEQTTNRSLEFIKYEILQKLKEERYNVTSVTKHSIAFKGKLGYRGSSFEASKRLSGGEFQIKQSENGATIVFNYYINRLNVFVILFIILTFCIIQKIFFAIPFFGIFFLFLSIIQYFTVKNIGKELLNNIS